jgi:F-type H+-transporting ATPase subunit alpha
MPVEEQVVSIFAGTRGYLDDIPVADVRRFETELLDYMRTRNASMLDEIRTSGVPDGLGDAVEAFKSQFLAKSGVREADPTKTSADEVGEATSQKTLATE